MSAFPEESGRKRYEGVRFNVISITRGWVGVKVMQLQSLYVPDYITPYITCHSCELSLWPDKTQGYKVKVQSETSSSSSNTGKLLLEGYSQACAGKIKSKINIYLVK